LIRTIIIAAALTAAISTFATPIQSSVVNAGSYRLELVTPAKGLFAQPKVELKIRVLDSPGKALPRLSASLSMPSMPGMEMAKPSVRPSGAPGEFVVTCDFPHRGAYSLTVSGGKDVSATFNLEVQAAPDSEMGGMPGMSGMDMGGMMGRLGPWSMSREGSGTSWLPESSPMFMKGLGKKGGFDLSLMGVAEANYTDAGGKRGDSQFYSNSMPMLMARKETGGGVLGFSLMASADAIFNGERGYPNLFQTGETAHGDALVDRQHPHDLIAELSMSYSRPLSSGARWFVYGGPVGEPASGGPMFLHRPSGMENPEAPISHHWFDSTHISLGWSRRA